MLETEVNEILTTRIVIPFRQQKRYNRNGEIVGVPIFGAQVDKYEQAVSDILDAPAA